MKRIYQQRKHIKHGTMVGAHPAVKQIWHTRYEEPAAISDGELVQDVCDSDADSRRDAKVLAGLAISSMRSREQAVIALRYYHDMTLREVAECLSITQERVRQIELKAFRRARTHMQANKDLITFLN